ncbi:ABC transporter permease [Pseudobutyrivibrio sp. LB2011]|uniref:ABC transporter permease n=1 Tax=Pseudobutyrivibrio sp. LB2011 TaxID=1408312 RepID=UPI0005D1364B|nr:ABC transporter permease [Pseudobutyrivibrio sp. LB2011]
MKKLLSLRYVVVSIALLIGVWQLAFNFSNYSSALFPSPGMAITALLEMVMSGQLLESFLTSIGRFVIGYGLSVIIAVLLGLVLGCLPNIFKYINPLLQILRPISPTAWMPFVVLLFGIGDLPAVVIIFIAAFFPVLLSTVSAVGKVDDVYFRVAENFGIKQPQLMWKVILPAVFLQIANAIHVALGSAWIFLVAGEMVGAQSGLGYQIIDARNNVRADMLLATIFVIGLLGLALDWLLGVLEKRILRVWGGE